VEVAAAGPTLGVVAAQVGIVLVQDWLLLLALITPSLLVMEVVAAHRIQIKERAVAILTFLDRRSATTRLQATLIQMLLLLMVVEVVAVIAQPLG
jgi:hypothetical protein